ncbi:MAG: PHP domain-containing protein [Zoogloeaceae bacterium]|nr:PHP domain-containing protein [Zoogloeaceae bacterium]
MPIPSSSFDFHCHSSVSDGLLSPGDLVARAAGRGVRRLALTDHDDTGGLEEAHRAAGEAGISFVNGVEISIEWEDISIHIVALDFDPACPALQEGLGRIRKGRMERAERMGDAFEAIGISGAFAGALAHCANPALVSRAHFARCLVERGLFREQREVFEHYLTPGKPGYVPHHWASLAEALSWVRAAGGVAVVAHPGRYRMARGQMRRFLAEFRELGGQAVEVSSGSHSPDHVRRFAHLTRHFGLHASGGSDFHAQHESRADLGGFLPLPEDLPPVWRLFSTRVQP